MKSKTKNTILFLLLALAGLALVFNGSFLSLVHNTLELRRLNRHLSALDKEHGELQEEYQKILSGDKSYLERTARIKYHMKKPGELEFRIQKEISSK